MVFFFIMLTESLLEMSQKVNMAKIFTEQATNESLVAAS